MPPAISKAFGAATIPLGGTTSLGFTITNPNLAVALTGVAFTDTLPSGLVVSTPNGLTGSCGGGLITATAGTNSVSLTGATLAANTQCIFSVNVTGVTAGQDNNVTSTVSSTNGGTGNFATASIIVVGPPTISKAFGASTVPLNGTTSLTITVTNPSSVALTGVAFTDTLPAGLVVANPNGLTGSCGGGTITATAGAGSITLSGATLAAGGSCTVGVNVTGITASTNINAVSVTSTNGGNGNTTTATIIVVAPPTISKAFATSNILVNGTASLSFTINNPNVGIALAGVAFSDTLPAGLVVANPANVSSACGGTVTATAGSNTVSLSGGSIAAGGSCMVGVNVTGTTTGPKVNTTGPVTSLTGGTGTTSNTATLNVDQLVVSIFDPNACVGPGDAVSLTAAITNGAAVAQTVSFTAALPPQLLALPGSCTASAGTCTVGNAGTVTLAATLAAGQAVTITYQAQVADITTGGTPFCINSSVSFAGGAALPVQACITVNCPPVGPGGIYPATSEVSDQKAGSILYYNLYTSGSSPTTQNTRISITNINLTRTIAVHLFFVDGTSCSVADANICLTPNQTSTFFASDLDPGTTGYIVAVAVDPTTGCPINFNYLIGDEYVKLTSGHAANLGAEAFAAIAGGLTFCSTDSVTAQLNFDGISYNRVPRVLAVDNVASRADGNDTLLIINRVGGNLANSASTLINLFGIAFDDSENALSFGFGGSSSSPGTCQFRGILSNTFPRLTPRFEQFIPAGRSGWLKIFSQADIGLLGAVLNANPNAGTSAGAFGQGHNLHKLTLTSAVTLTIPIFPPGC